MPRAQCYYEILGIPETATTEQVKQAYKKLALVWHPDKNQSNQEEAHAKFQVILKAYETLGDNKEREWYDRHKDQILSDKNEAANCINLFQYFSSACYANYDDSEDGFYTVYRKVFEQIADEERQAMQLAAKYAKSKSKSLRSDSDAEMLPTFGHSNSPYDDTVRLFYAYWSGFSTQLTFDHLDKWNTTEAENRRILRAMDKENKKVKDASKRERNTNVRNLVEFIKKRDRRLKAHKSLVEQQNELNRKKTAEKQRQQREKSLMNTAEYKPATYLDMNDVEEQLQQLENEYMDLKKQKRARRRQRKEQDEEDDCDEEDRTQQPTDDCDKTDQPDGINGGTAGEGNEELDEDVAAKDDDDQDHSFFCPACSKDFRSINAFENHEGSKKHKQNVQKLTKLLKAEEGKLNNK